MSILRYDRIEVMKEGLLIPLRQRLNLLFLPHLFYKPFHIDDFNAIELFEVS